MSSPFMVFAQNTLDKYLYKCQYCGQSMDTRTTQYLFAAAIFFFIGWAILSGVSDHDMFFDRLYGAGEVFLVYLFWRKYRFSTLQLGLIGAAILLHQIKLYGNTYFGVEFDTYMHVVATFAIACLLASVIAQSLKPQHHHWLLRPFIVFTATVGIATTVEPIEYLGYATL